MVEKYHVKFDIPKSISDRNLQKIINFYLLNCPVEGISFRGKKFGDYGFSGSIPFSKLKKSMLAVASESLSKNYFPCKMDQLSQKYSLVSKASPPDEYCVFLVNEKRGVLASLYSAIRNAFAHGSYNVKSYNGIRIYFFSNFHNCEKARIVLREDTLLEWIRLIENGYKTPISIN